MRGDVLEFERRRRWGDDKKLAIVLSVGVGGATVRKSIGCVETRRECLKLCVSERAHAVFRYVQASKRPANIMAS